MRHWDWQRALYGDPNVDGLVSLVDVDKYLNDRPDILFRETVSFYYGC